MRSADAFYFCSWGGTLALQLGTGDKVYLPPPAGIEASIKHNSVSFINCRHKERQPTAQRLKPLLSTTLSLLSIAVIKSVNQLRRAFYNGDRHGQKRRVYKAEGSLCFTVALRISRTWLKSSSKQLNAIFFFCHMCCHFKSLRFNIKSNQQMY